MEDVNLDYQIKSTLDDINEVANEVSLFGFSSLDEREIVYGITTAIGIDPTIDNILEVGSNVGEFYFYIERLFGTQPLGYYGIENNEKLIDIARFRISDGNVEFYNIELQTVIEYLRNNNIENVKQMMEINVDWSVLINQFHETTHPATIVSMIEMLIKIPNKGIVITNKFTDDNIISLVAEFLKSDTLKNRFIFRSDFLSNWYSFYFYNNR